jgi:hypothetical protein
MRTPVKTPETSQAGFRAATTKILADPNDVARLASMAVEPMSMHPSRRAFSWLGKWRKWKTIAAAMRIQVD